MSVSVVVISHSKNLADGLKELIAQAQPEVDVAAAGGTDEGEIGTSVIRIKTEIESVLSDDGVILLFDIGSAKMNAELACEMLGNPEHIVIADAPLVEGSYVAVVEAGMGKAVDEVKEAAEKTRTMNKM